MKKTKDITLNKDGFRMRDEKDKQAVLGEILSLLDDKAYKVLAIFNEKQRKEPSHLQYKSETFRKYVKELFIDDTILEKGKILEKLGHYWLYYAFNQKDLIDELGEEKWKLFHSYLIYDRMGKYYK